MDNASRLSSNRQDATTASSCVLCVSAGFSCYVCHKSFVVGDLRITTGKGRSHYKCETRSDGPCDVLVFPDDPPQHRDAVTFLKVGKIVAEKVTSSISGAREDRIVAGILATGYLDDLPSGSDHIDHIGSIPSEVCDFCQAREIAGRLPAPTFWAPVAGFIGQIILCYEGDWTYCSGCAPAVARRDHAELAERACSAPSDDTEPVARKHRFERLFGKVLTGEHING